MPFKKSQLIPLEYKFKFNEIEIKTLNLMRSYEKLRRKYCCDPSYMLFSRKEDPRKSRFFKSFEKLAIESESKKTRIPQAKLFILAQFEILRSEYKSNKVYCPPQYLFSKYAWRRYRRYLDQICTNQNIKNNNRKKTRSNKINIIRDLRGTFEFIKNFNINNFGETTINYEKIFKDDRIWIYILNNTISPYFLAISKTFSKINIPNEIHKEIPENFDIYKKEVLLDKDILNIAKELFKDEINELQYQ